MNKTDKVVYSLLAFIFIIIAWIMFLDKNSTASQEIAETKPSVEIVKTEPSVEICSETDLDDRIKKSQEAILKKDYESAIDNLSQCYKKTPKGLKALKLLSQARIAVEKKQFEEKKLQLAEWKKEGVAIGMTQERVLQSSWGKPQKINTTTTKYGDREQWVYNGGYLYFENGLLTTIQN